MNQQGWLFKEKERDTNQVRSQVVFNFLSKTKLFGYRCSGQVVGDTGLMVDQAESRGQMVNTEQSLTTSPPPPFLTSN